MKFRFLPLLLLSFLLIHCQQPPIILTTQSAFTLPDGSGFSAVTNFIYFRSEKVGAATQVTFSNDDGDYVRFKMGSPHTGNLVLASIQLVEMSFVGAQGATLTPTDGFLNITGILGSGAGVTGFSGSFQFNVQTTDEDNTVGAPGDIGTIKGVFNYNAAAQ